MGTDCASRDRNNGKHAEVEKSAGQHGDWGGPLTCVESEINEAERSRENLLLPSAPATARHWFFLKASGARLVLLGPELVAVLHDRRAAPVVQLVQHPREATALLVGLGKQLQLLTAVLDVGEAHTHQA